MNESVSLPCWRIAGTNSSLEIALYYMPRKWAVNMPFYCIQKTFMSPYSWNRFPSQTLFSGGIDFREKSPWTIKKKRADEAFQNADEAESKDDGDSESEQELPPPCEEGVYGDKVQGFISFS